MAKRPKPLAPEQLSKDGAELFEALNGESNISCALMGGAFIEKAITALLGKHFVDGETAQQLLTDRTLNEYFAAASVCYCVGLISKNEFISIQKIGEIRNRFAHSHLRMTFEDATIRRWCDEMPTPDMPFPNRDELLANHRSRFSVSVAVLMMALLGRATTIKRCESLPEPMLRTVNKT